MGNAETEVRVEDGIAPADELAALRAELHEVHQVLDMLWAGDKDQTAADRLRDYLADAAGERVGHVLNPELGRALARVWQSTGAKVLGHNEDCPCSPCREARLLK